MFVFREGSPGSEELGLSGSVSRGAEGMFGLGAGVYGVG